MKIEEKKKIMTKMDSFRKAKYSKQELLPEMLSLQDDIVRIVFDKEYGPLGRLRVDDAVKKLKEINDSRGGIANEQMYQFEKASQDLVNRIKAEISGKKGEQKAFGKINSISAYKQVLKNVEIESEGRRTELDAVVIMKKGLTIVEVKNDAKNIFIDETGNYFIDGRFKRLDCNIRKAMQLKENLLRKVLNRSGIYDFSIHSIVVFTNNIEIHNEDSNVSTCFLGQLPFYINDVKSNKILSREKIDTIGAAIRLASQGREYPVDFNVSQYKENFAELLVELNCEKNNKNLYEEVKIPKSQTMQLDTQQIQYFERKKLTSQKSTYDEVVQQNLSLSRHSSRRQSTIWEKTIDECSDYNTFGGGSALWKVAGGLALIAAGIYSPRIATSLLRKRILL